MEGYQFEALGTKIASWNEGQVKAIKKYNFTNITALQTKALNPEAVLWINDDQFKKMNHSNGILVFDKNKIQKLSIEKIRLIAPSIMELMSKDQISFFDENQIQNGITDEQLISMANKDKIQYLKMNNDLFFNWGINKRNVLGYNIKSFIMSLDIVSLTKENFENLANLVEYFDLNQIKLLLLGQIKALTPDQIAALTPDQIKALTPDQIKALTPDQIAALTPDQIKALTPDQIKVLDKNQIEALSAGQIEVLNCDQINALSYSQLSFFTEKQMPFLPKYMINVMCGDRMEFYNPNKVKTWIDGIFNKKKIQALLPDQIQFLDISYFPQDFLLSFNNNQISALNEKQINSLSDDKIKLLNKIYFNGKVFKYLFDKRKYRFSVDEFKIFTENQHKLLYYDIIKDLSMYQIQALKINFLNIDFFSNLIEKAYFCLSHEQWQSLTIDLIKKLKDDIIFLLNINDVTEEVFNYLLKYKIEYLTAEQFTKLNKERTQILTIDNIKKLKWNQIEGLNIEYLSQDLINKLNDKTNNEFKDIVDKFDSPLLIEEFIIVNNELEEEIIYKEKNKEEIKNYEYKKSMILALLSGDDLEEFKENMSLLNNYDYEIIFKKFYLFSKSQLSEEKCFQFLFNKHFLDLYFNNADFSHNDLFMNIEKLFFLKKDNFVYIIHSNNNQLNLLKKNFKDSFCLFLEPLLNDKCKFSDKIDLFENDKNDCVINNMFFELFNKIKKNPNRDQNIINNKKYFLCLNNILDYNFNKNNKIYSLLDKINEKINNKKINLNT